MTSDSTSRPPGDVPDPSALAEELADLMQSLRASVEAAQALGEHTTGSCQACPVCRLLDLVRSTRPEALTHLAAAWSELGAAAAVLFSADPSGPPVADEKSDPGPADAAPGNGDSGTPVPEPPRAQRILIG